MYIIEIVLSAFFILCAMDILIKNQDETDVNVIKYIVAFILLFLSQILTKGLW